MLMEWQSYYFLFEEYTFRDLERLFFEVVQIQIGYFNCIISSIYDIDKVIFIKAMEIVF